MSNIQTSPQTVGQDGQVPLIVPGAHMSEEATPETPSAPEAEQAETFDADYVKKLRQEAAKYRSEAKLNAEAASRLAEIEQAKKSEEEKLLERLSEAEAKAAALELAVTRDRIAKEKGIADFAEFLTGTTEEEISLAADRLAERLPGRTPGKPVEQLTTAATSTDAAAATPDAWIRGAVAARARGRG